MTRDFVPKCVVLDEQQIQFTITILEEFQIQGRLAAMMTSVLTALREAKAPQPEAEKNGGDPGEGQ